MLHVHLTIWNHSFTNGQDISTSLRMSFMQYSTSYTGLIQPINKISRSFHLFVTSYYCTSFKLESQRQNRDPFSILHTSPEVKWREKTTTLFDEIFLNIFSDASASHFERKQNLTKPYFLLWLGLSMWINKLSSSSKSKLVYVRMLKFLKIGTLLQYIICSNTVLGKPLSKVLTKQDHSSRDNLPKR